MKQEHINLLLTPFFSLFQREVKRFLRVIVQTLLIPLVNSILYLLIFGISLGQQVSAQNGVSYLEFLIPGLVMMGLLNNAFQNCSSSIATSRFYGNLEDLKVAPIGPSQIIAAMALAGLLRGILVGAIVFLAGASFHFGVYHQWIEVKHPLILILFLAIGGLTFAMIGIMAAFKAKNFDQLEAVGGFLLLPLIYLGGVFFSLQGLHPFWQSLSRLNPILYLINGVRYGVLGISDVSWEKSALFAGATMVVLFWLCRRIVKHGFYSRW